MSTPSTAFASSPGTGCRSAESDRETALVGAPARVVGSRRGGLVRGRLTRRALSGLRGRYARRVLSGFRARGALGAGLVMDISARTGRCRVLACRLQIARRSACPGKMYCLVRDCVLVRRPARRRWPAGCVRSRSRWEAPGVSLCSARSRIRRLHIVQGSVEALRSAGCARPAWPSVSPSTSWRPFLMVRWPWGHRLEVSRGRSAGGVRVGVSLGVRPGDRSPRRSATG